MLQQLCAAWDQSWLCVQLAQKLAQLKQGVCLSPPTEVCPEEQIPRGILVSSQGGKQVGHRKMERRY